MYLDRLRDALPRVEERIGAALARSGRTDAVTIVGVTKGHPPEAVRAAAAVGLTRCGENRVAELEAKVGAVGRDRVEWHLVGHLQRNKVRRALPLFDLVHSIDSLRLADELSAEAERAGVEVRGLVQVNVSGEAAKGGFAEAEVLAGVARVAALPRLRIQGLMTMAPLDAAERELRRIFARARALFDACGREVTGFDARYLSMGMSNDFETAVMEGSTMVRLGTVLFGERGS
jgi:PLP dependent protein